MRRSDYSIFCLILPKLGLIQINFAAAKSTNPWEIYFGDAA